MSCPPELTELLRLYGKAQNILPDVPPCIETTSKIPAQWYFTVVW